MYLYQFMPILNPKIPVRSSENSRLLLRRSSFSHAFYSVEYFHLLNESPVDSYFAIWSGVKVSVKHLKQVDFIYSSIGSIVCVGILFVIFRLLFSSFSLSFYTLFNICIYFGLIFLSKRGVFLCLLMLQ